MKKEQIESLIEHMETRIDFHEQAIKDYEAHIKKSKKVILESKQKIEKAKKINTNKLVCYGGDGFGACQKNGLYSIKFGEKTEKRFSDLNLARDFYDKIEGEKFFWDITVIPELIDGWCYSENDEPQLPK